MSHRFDYPPTMALRIRPRKTAANKIISDYSLHICADNPFELFAEFIKRANKDVFVRRFLPAFQAGNFMINFE